MKLNIVTPEKQVAHEEIQSVTLPTSNGEITVLPHHIPLVTDVVAGELIITQKNGTKDYFATGSGFAQIAGNEVNVLTDLVEHSQEINEKQVEEARKRAEDALARADQMTNEEIALAQAVIAKSLAQLKVRRRRHHTTIP